MKKVSNLPSTTNILVFEMSDGPPLLPISNSILKFSIPSSTPRCCSLPPRYALTKQLSVGGPSLPASTYISLNHIYLNSSETCYWYKCLKHEASSNCPFICICENTRSPWNLPNMAKETTVGSEERVSHVTMGTRTLATEILGSTPWREPSQTLSLAPTKSQGRFQCWVASGQTTNREGTQPHPSTVKRIKVLLSSAHQGNSQLYPPPVPLIRKLTQAS